MNIKVNRNNAIVKHFDEVQLGAVFYKSNSVEDFYIKTPELYNEYDGGDMFNAIHLEIGEPEFFTDSEFVIIPHRAEMIVDP